MDERLADSFAFLNGGGVLARRIRDFDWSSTSLGALPHWPAALRTTVAIALRSKVPMVTLWKEDGVMIYNDAYAVFAGRRDATLLGSRVREGWPEVAAFNDHVMKVCLDGGNLAFQDQELTLFRDGRAEQVWMNLDYSPVLDEQGTPFGVMAIVIETTAKIQAEAALRHSEAVFRTYAEVMPNHVWAARSDGAVDWFNPKVYEFSGATPGSLDGARWGDIVHPDDREAAVSQWLEALKCGTTYETEFRIRAASGHYRWHLVRALPIRDDGGHVVRWIGTNTDIEDHKATAVAMAQLNQTLEQQVMQRTADRDRMWALSTDIMLVADFEARIVAVNPAWTQMLGWSQTELIGKAFLDLVHPDDIPETLAEIGGLAKGQTTFRFENRYRRKDGSHCLISWTAVPDERYIHAVGRDITAERDAAEQLRDAEAALQQSQKMEAIGQLTGGVAHDFNNILQVISGNLHLLTREHPDNERIAQRVSRAMASVQRGAKLASQLLAFSRRQALEPRVLHLGRLVAGMEDMLRRTLGEAVEIEVVISAGLWNVFADPAQVENALLNLAINARDAMSGAGKLTIEAGNALLDDEYARGHIEVPRGQYVMLAISDMGTGMAPEVLAKAFEPFFSTKPEGKGTGLGLSMVHGFVKQSGGHVKLYSEVGHGTTVKIYLPRSTLALDSVQALPAETAQGGTEAILVVEDDEGVRSTVVEMLTQMGYVVLQADTADAALALLEAGAKVDLLFTDVVMPGKLKSPELARVARRLLPDLRVLFTSGYTENAIVHGGRLDPGTDLLGKPYTQSALARRIRQSLETPPTPVVKP